MFKGAVVMNIFLIIYLLLLSDEEIRQNVCDTQSAQHCGGDDLRKESNSNIKYAIVHASNQRT